MTQAPSIFKRFLLPGFAFKAVVIGGGYATGRELAEFFLPSGPWGGLLGMLLAMACWSLICASTFLYAHATRTYDYGAFFRSLLGRAAFLFDGAYACLVLIMLSVFGAAAGAIGAALFGWPELIGTLGLMAGIATVAAFGNESVERLFKYVTYFLYTVYVAFFVLSLLKTSGRLAANFALVTPSTGWVAGGLTYAGYNVVGAVVILPVLRHLTSRRDALIAGVLGGFGRGFSANSSAFLTAPSVNVSGQRSTLSPTDIAQGGLGQGVAQSADMVSKYLIERAEQYQPVVEMPTGLDVEVVFLDGVFIRN